MARSASLYISSDETFLHVCDICEEDDRHVEAVALCSVCDQYFCVTCKTVHERSKATKGHMLVTGDNLRKTNVAMSSKISCNVHGLNEEVKYFCLVHEVPCCEKCKLIDHRGCKRIKTLTNIVSKINPKDEGQTLLQKSTKLAEEVEHLKSTFENELSRLAEQQESMIETIHERRLKIDAALDKWEAESVKTVKEKCEKESRVLHDNVSICLGVVPEVRANVAKMQKALKMSGEEIFIVMKEIQKDNNKYNDTFLEMHKVSHTPDIYLEKDSITETINTHLHETINVGVRYHKDKNVLPSFSTRPYKDRVALDAGEINVSLKSDIETPKITGIEVMHDQNNMLLFCDTGNRKLKLLDDRNSSSVEYCFPTSLKRMCKTDGHNEVMVSQPNERRLQLVSVDNGEIVMGETIKTTNIYDINRYCNCFITQSSSNKTGWVFDVTSKDGKRIRNIRTETSRSKVFSGTLYQTIDSETLYVTDSKHGCIGLSMTGDVGLSMTGDVVFRFNDKLMKDGSGVTTDPEGNVYIAGTKSNNVVIVNNKGEMIKVLLDAIEKPRFMVYDEPTNTLFVYLMGTSIVKMFHLM